MFIAVTADAISTTAIVIAISGVALRYTNKRV